MRILERYVTWQLIPVWLWCLTVFVFVSVLIDFFGHLEEILRYHIPAETVAQYYLNFTPLVVVRASPIALLLSAAFVSMRLARHQELLAMHASGMSLERAAAPFVFVGWLVSLIIFAVSEGLVPETSARYEQVRYEAFEGRQRTQTLENVATLDVENRLYHARLFDLEHHELTDLTILEHDARNRPTQSLYANRAVFTPHGLLLLYGTIYRMTPRGTLAGEPQPFMERFLKLPVAPETFRQPETQPETMRFRQLRRLIVRLRQTGMTDVRRFRVELASKLTLPLMNIVMCLIGFVGSASSHARSHLRGLGISLFWGVVYYGGVAVSQGFGKEGWLPPVVSAWAPHLVAVALCLREARR